MTTIDVVMVLGALKALHVLFRHRATILGMKIARPVQAIAAGLCIISGYYLADLYTMLVMPLYASDEAAMAAMRNLHLNWGWLVVLAGFAAIVAGLAYLVAKLFPQIATIIKSLEAEVVERKRVKDALRESEEQRRLIADNMPAVIAYVDANQRYGFINRRYEEWFGISSEEAYGRRVRDVVGEAAYGAVKKNLAKALSGERVAFETSLPIKNAGTRHVQATYVPHPSDDGGIKGVFALVTDITERKRLEGELLRRERLATLGQLTATVSHELRNPLGVIRTSAFILRDGLKDEMPRARRALERVERSVMRCDRIIDEMLDFTRISDLEPEPTALDDWLAGVLEEQPLPTGISLRQELQLPETTVPLDRDRFRRAVINVFDNACQAMLGAGESETEPAERLLTVRTRECDGRIEVVFEDQGPGIARHVYERIFEPLYSTKGLGVGLGLPVVKQIMEQHGGGIEIETEEGRGTAVCLWLDRNARAENVAA
jgi:PAS domain S-box-containing protein